MSWERSIELKSESEIDLMRKAGRINALALEAVKKAIKPGVTTQELDEIARMIILQHNAKPAFLGVPGAYPYPATTTMSINNELVHGIPSMRKLQEGDIISVDCGTFFEGYVGDSAFSKGIGKLSEAAKRLIEVTENALYIGIDLLREGNRVGDIGHAIESYVHSEGYYITREYTGHGIGRSMWEGPQVPNYGVPGKGTVLQAGMVIALEPMVLIGTSQTQVLDDKWTVASKDGSLTAHFEHTVAITKNGPEILTKI